MPVPKRKRSKSRRDKRFANKNVEEIAIAHCGQCKEALAPHQACKKCGFYKGSKVLATKVDRGIKRREQQLAKKARQNEASPSEAENNSQ